MKKIIAVLAMSVGTILLYSILLFFFDSFKKEDEFYQYFMYGHD